VAGLDPGGALKVGPSPAGADPGPLCYGRGGTEPTVTDAHAVLGTVAGTLPGGIPIDAGAARAAVATLGEALGIDDVEDIARGIVAVADAEMLGALRVMTVQQGVDPRDFTLLAFGGAGGLHACALAEALEMRRVMVPAAAGVLSALGLAAADQRRDEARTVMLRGDGLTAEALQAAAGSGAEVAWEARYAGQSHELTLEGVDPEPGAIADELRRVHEERYGFAPAADAAVEVVTVRRTVRTPGPPLTLATGARALPGDAGARGPRTIALPGATFALRAGWRITDDTGGWIVAEREADLEADA
jgi:N-methylhydantoinase A/oxoprolinase/acetone carboxylase beta subunit